MPSACTRENAVRIRASAPTSVAVAEGLRHWIVAPVMRVQVPPVTPMKGGLPWRRCPKEHQFMSRSYRQPYAATTGVQSASRDKQQASHSVRRRINQWLHIQYAKGGEFELVPHRLECQHNDVWCWDRDGKRRL